MTVLVNYLKHEDVRASAAGSFTLFGGEAKDAIPAVKAALEGKDSAVRKQARLTLKSVFSKQ